MKQQNNRDKEILTLIHVKLIFEARESLHILYLRSIEPVHIDAYYKY